MVDDCKWHDWGFPDPVGSQLFLGRLLHTVVRKGNPWQGLINGEKVLVHGSLEGVKQALDWEIARRIEGAAVATENFNRRRREASNGAA